MNNYFSTGLKKPTLTLIEFIHDIFEKKIKYS